MDLAAAEAVAASAADGDSNSSYPALELIKQRSKILLVLKSIFYLSSLTRARIEAYSAAPSLAFLIQR